MSRQECKVGQRVTGTNGQRGLIVERRSDSTVVVQWDNGPGCHEWPEDLGLEE